MAPKPDPRGFVGYVRVSTDEQASSGLGLDAQERSIRAYADLYGLRLIAIERDEGYSGKDLRRPGLANALGAVSRGEAAGLVFAKLDRLTRSVRDLAEMLDLCLKRGIVLHSVSERLDTSSAAGRMLVGILGTIAQWERESTAERTRAALAEVKARGIPLGECPFGVRWKRDEAGELVRDGNGYAMREADPDEQETLRMIRDARERGVSYRGVCDMLTEAGRRTRYGGPWLPGTVRGVLGLVRRRQKV